MFLSSLLLVPMLVGFGLLVLVDVLGLTKNLLLATVIKVPDDFIRGLLMAMYVRYLLLHETPEQMMKSPAGQISVLHSTLIFTALNFVYGGIMAGVGTMMMGTKDAASLPPASAFLGLAAMGFVVWLFRFQWLPIVAAAGMPVVTFAKEMGGGFVLSLRIFALMFFISIPSFFIMGLATEISANIAQIETMNDMAKPLLWLLLLLSVFLSLLTSLVQTAASVHALKFCMKGSA